MIAPPPPSAAPAPALAAAGFHLLAAVLPAIAVVLWFRPRSWLSLLGLFWGMLTAYIDLQSHQAQLPALMLLAGGFFLGFARPTGLWRWALLVGAWVPALALVRWALAAAAGDFPFYPGGSFLALVPALVGAAGGALTGQAAAQRDLGCARPGAAEVGEK
jgi:hypothetical protein